jgi:hypothetical protein
MYMDLLNNNIMIIVQINVFLWNLLFKESKRGKEPT